MGKPRTLLCAGRISCAAGVTMALALGVAFSAMTGQAVAKMAKAAAACGTASYKSPAGSAPVFGKLPASVRAAYNGYEYPVFASKWAKWHKSGKISIGVAEGQPSNEFEADVYKILLASLKKMPNVGKVTVLTTATATDIPSQIAQYEAILKDRPDLIIAGVITGQPFVPLVKKAASEGIPTISVLSTIDSPDAVSVVPNTYLAALQTTESIVKQIGGKGNALEVQGIPGISINADALAGINAVLKNCPNINVVGSITGEYQEAVTKSQAISFLGTHTQTINLVLGTGSAAAGIIQAFTEEGRPVPALTDQSIDEPTAGYWLANKSMKASISGGGSNAFGGLLSMVVKKMVDGDGIQVSSVVQPQPIITPKTISLWGKSSWNINTPSNSVSDPASAYDNAALVDPLFSK